MASERLVHMLSSFFAVLAAAATKKQVVGAWLVLLSLAVAQIGEKVYVERTRDIAVIETKVDQIQESLKRLESGLEKNSIKLDKLLEETVRVKSDLDSHTAKAGDHKR